MKPLHKSRFERARRVKQRGVVLFFALIALVAMSLAAVALIRSVDTSTLIAGNLAFKQAAKNSGDRGVEDAITWLATTNAGSALDVLNDPGHPFNNDIPTQGYYSSSALNLTDGTGIKWKTDNSDSAAVNPDAFGNPRPDASGNTSRYVIQRMCRTAGQPIKNADCLFSDALQNLNGMAVRLPQEVCSGPGCPAAGQTPLIRITVRTTGPRSTLSYVQAFVY